MTSRVALKTGAIYRKAAERILLGESLCCCWAIQVLNGDCQEFRDLFTPGEDHDIELDPDGWEWNSLSNRGEARNERAIALCFMAAIAERP